MKVLLCFTHLKADKKYLGRGQWEFSQNHYKIRDTRIIKCDSWINLLGDFHLFCNKEMPSWGVPHEKQVIEFLWYLPENNDPYFKVKDDSIKS